jgi:hypothetical protein
MKLIRDTFNILLEAKSIDRVNSILDDLHVDKKYRMDDKTYPQIKFKITKNEIDELKKEKLLSEENFITDVSNQNTLTKLLYSVAWKNGDLKKIRHIIEGITSDPNDNKKNALVFYQFGKFLTKKPGEPIIDQHVLRAFGIYKALKDNNKQAIERLSTLSIVSSKEKNLIEDYKNWLKNELTVELLKCDNYAYHVDKVLFAVGKKVKNDYMNKAQGVINN